MIHFFEHREVLSTMQTYLLKILWRMLEVLESLMVSRQVSKGHEGQRGYPARIALGLTLLFSLKLCDWLLPRWLLVAILLAPLGVYLSVPLCYWSCPWFRRQVVYMSVLPGRGPFCDLRDPVKAGLSRARNFYFRTQDGIQLGIWHVWPESCSSSSDVDADNEFTGDLRPVILMLRGSIGSRGTPWRVQAIRRLTGPEVDSHVITLDYRGFGDSTKVKPTVQSLTSDVLGLYRWLVTHRQVDAGRIFLHGQSLGSAVALHLAQEIQDHDLTPPAGVILLCPFTSIAEACSFHPVIVHFYSYFPFKETWLRGPTRRDPDIAWDNMSRISRVRSPVLILHAKDDWMIPYSFGLSLYHAGKTSGHNRPIKMVAYEPEMGYGHNRMFCDPGYPQLLRSFLDEFAVVK